MVECNGVSGSETTLDSVMLLSARSSELDITSNFSYFPSATASRPAHFATSLRPSRLGAYAQLSP